MTLEHIATGVVVPRTIQLGLQSPVGASFGDGSHVNATVTLIEGDAAPAVAVSKQVNTAQAHVGDTITYTYRITNTGNVTLTYVVQGSDLPGPLTNTVTVNCTDTFGTIVTDSDTVTVALLPQEEESTRIFLPHLERQAQGVTTH